MTAAIANLQQLHLHCRASISFNSPNLTFVPPNSLFKVGVNSQTWGKRDTSLRKIWCNNKLLQSRYLVTRCSGSSSSNDTLEGSSVQSKTPFGYTRKDVLLIGLGVTLFGVALKSGLEKMLLHKGRKRRPMLSVFSSLHNFVCGLINGPSLTMVFSAVSRS